MNLDNLYQELILDHYKRPHGSGLRSPFDCEVHHTNPVCGDEVTLRVKFGESKIEDISYQAQGCSISQASTSMLYDLINGKTIDECSEIFSDFHHMITSRGNYHGNEEIIEDAIALSGVSKYPARVKCALLGWMAFKDCLDNNEKGN